MENFDRLNKDNSDNMQVNANVTFQLYDVNVQNSNASRRTFLAQKSWTTLKVSMFQSVSVQERETRHWPDSLSTPIEDRIWVLTVRLAPNERSGVSKSTPVVPSSLLTFATDFSCLSWGNLLKFSQCDSLRSYIKFCPNLNLKKFVSQCLLGLQAGTPLDSVGTTHYSIALRISSAVWNTEDEQVEDCKKKEKENQAFAVNIYILGKKGG